MNKIRIITILLWIFLPVIISATVIHVPGDQPTIQAGIDAALDGDTVLVADGTYTGDGNRDLNFKGKAIIVRSDNGPNSCVIDCGGTESDPHQGFNFNHGEGIDSMLEGFTIKNGFTSVGGYWSSGIRCSGSSPVITNSNITGNRSLSGGGITCFNASPMIIDNMITENTATSLSGHGGGVYCYKSSPIIRNNTIASNTAYQGGGISCKQYSSPTIFDNIIAENKADHRGGGIRCEDRSSPIIKNNLIVNNHAGNRGGGIDCYYWSSPSIINTNILYNNAATTGGGINCHVHCEPSIMNSIIWFNTPNSITRTWDSSTTITYSNVHGGPGGNGNIRINPLFVTGPRGDYYLSQIFAGQAQNSPCLDAGDPASELIEGTTRTDSAQDSGIVDMGYHYPFPLQGLIVGPGPGNGNPPLVRVFPPEQDAFDKYEFSAYGPQHYGVNVTSGDISGNGYSKIITGAGPGAVFGPHVRGFEVDGTPISGVNFLAYGARKYGVNVATGDIDRDGYDEIITGAGPGAVFGPHVRAFDYDGAPPVMPVQGVSFMAYNTRQRGVNIASGDIDGDNYDEIVTGPGPGVVFGPHVRGWNVDGGPAAAISEVSFFAFGAGRYGVVVTCGDADGDDMDEIVAARGPSSNLGAYIRGWNFDGASISALPGFRFYAWEPSEARYGARIFAGADLDVDGRDELVVGAGPDPSISSPVKVYHYDGTGVSLWFSLHAFPSWWMHGANVAAGRF